MADEWIKRKNEELIDEKSGDESFSKNVNSNKVNYQR